MANQWFEFKQFRVEQDRASFKVGTDACLLGSWVDVQSARRVLEIGSGTGVISLMLAQRSSAFIHAIEIDPESASQTALNFEGSPWKNRLTSQRIDFHHFELDSSSDLFDLIVSNPPFFKDSTRSADSRKKTARHEDSLKLADLVRDSKKLLSESGKLALVLPADSKPHLLQVVSANGFKVDRLLEISPLPNRPVNRILIECRFIEATTSPQVTHMTLYSQQNIYSKEALELLSPFYLKL